LEAVKRKGLESLLKMLILKRPWELYWGNLKLIKNVNQVNKAPIPELM